MFLLSLLEPTALRLHAPPDARYRHRRVEAAVAAVQGMVWQLHRAEMSDSAKRAARRHISAALAPDLSAVELDERLEDLSVEAYRDYASRMRGNHLMHLVLSSAALTALDDEPCETALALDAK
jgi:hypothetical protein